MVLYIFTLFIEICIVSPGQMWRRLPEPCRAVKETPKRRKRTTRTWVWIRAHTAKPQSNLNPFVLLNVVLHFCRPEATLCSCSGRTARKPFDRPSVLLLWRSFMNQSLKFDFFLFHYSTDCQCWFFQAFLGFILNKKSYWQTKTIQGLFFFFSAHKTGELYEKHFI